MTKRLGILRIDFKLLEEILLLPKNIKIEAIIGSPEVYRHAIVRLEGGNLPEVNEGDQIPEMIAEYTSYHCDTCNSSNPKLLKLRSRY